MPETTQPNDGGGAGSVPVFERRSKKVWSGDVWSGE